MHHVLKIAALFARSDMIAAAIAEISRNGQRDHSRNRSSVVAAGERCNAEPRFYYDGPARDGRA
jgi:hypothetical protein